MPLRHAAADTPFDTPMPLLLMPLLAFDADAAMPFR